MQNLYSKIKPTSLKLPIVLRNKNLTIKDKIRQERKTIIQYAKKAVSSESINFTKVSDVEKYYNNVIDILAEHLAELNVSLEQRSNV
jgi:hypothetical protein